VSDLRRQRGPHVFVSDLDAALLDDADRHHLTKALRLRRGDPLTASDGDGAWRAMVLGDEGVLEPVGPIVVVAAPQWSVSLAVALTKGTKPELVVQKATELGVDSVVIFAADHSVPRWAPDKQQRSLERLARVSREAAMQSRQVRVPAIMHVDTLDKVVEYHKNAELGGRVAIAQFGGEPVSPEDQIIAIGPEGGWSDRERGLVPKHIDLGGSVLRAETAAIVVAAEMLRVRNLGR